VTAQAEIKLVGMPGGKKRQPWGKSGKEKPSLRRPEIKVGGGAWQERKKQPTKETKDAEVGN